MNNIDIKYFKAIKENNISLAEEIVKQAANAAGYNIGPVYHGTTNNKLNFIFPLMSHWGTIDAAKKRISDVGGKGARIYSAFLKINNPIITGDLGLFSAFDIISEINGIEGISALISIAIKMMSEKQKEEAAKRMGFIEKASDAEIAEEALNQYLRLNHRGSDVWEALFGDSRLTNTTENDIWTRCMEYAVDVASNYGIDGIIYKNEVESPGKLSYIAFKPSQIKSAEIIVKDNQGNIIPLSKRFNDSSNDIRETLEFKKWLIFKK